MTLLEDAARELYREWFDWMASTIIEIIISEAQNEVRDFEKWGVDIVPHRVVMKTGFETTDGKRVVGGRCVQGSEASFPGCDRVRDVVNRSRR
jgi:hypothetical protein